MKKQEAIDLIKNSSQTDFVVRARRDRKTCDLCGRKVDRREFTITGCYIRGDLYEGYEFKDTGCAHISKHICSDCYAKMFPEDVVRRKMEEK